MDSATDRLAVYRDLADTYDRLGQVSMRDRFLILAADAALDAGQAGEAERLRQRLLHGSRYHMLRPYGSFAEALGAADVQTYLRDLRANYPLEVARQLLATLVPAGTAPQAQEARQQAADPPPAAIPPTAPLLDLYGRKAPAGKPAWQSQVPSPPLGFAEPMEMTPAPPAPRPEGARGPARPAAAAPAPAPVPATRALPLSALQAPRGRPAERPEPSPGSGLAFTLVGVAVTAALALAAFTLARPWLPL